jgi:uncharacterized protein (TIGR02246 family)
MKVMKRTPVYTIAVALAASILSGCGAAAPSSVPTATPDYASEVRAAMQKYSDAVRAMNSDAIAAFYTPDGEAWDRGKLNARGPDAIRTFLKSFDGVVRVDSYQTTITSVTIQGEEATITGTYEQTYTLLADGRSGTARGTYTAEWVRQPDGAWLVQRMTTAP